MQQLQSSLDCTNELLKKAMETARTAEAEAKTAADAAQQEIDSMKAKLAEAAGVLNAKEELREARCVAARHGATVTRSLSLCLSTCQQTEQCRSHWCQCCTG